MREDIQFVIVSAAVAELHRCATLAISSADGRDTRAVLFVIAGGVRSYRCARCLCSLGRTDDPQGRLSSPWSSGSAPGLLRLQLVAVVGTVEGKWNCHVADALLDSTGGAIAPPTCWEGGRGLNSSGEVAGDIASQGPSLVLVVVVHKGFVMVALQDE